MTDLAVRAEWLRKRFGTTQALDGVDLAMRRGTVLGVLGPNGAGKTTAVRVLATLLRPDEGHTEVAGIDVLRHPQRVRRRIGLTGQYASVDEDLTGTQNLVLAAAAPAPGHAGRLGRRCDRARTHHRHLGRRHAVRGAPLTTAVSSRSRSRWNRKKIA